MERLSSFFRGLFSFLGTHSQAEDRVATYVIREHRRGRRLSEKRGRIPVVLRPEQEPVARALGHQKPGGLPRQELWLEHPAEAGDPILEVAPGRVQRQLRPECFYQHVPMGHVIGRRQEVFEQLLDFGTVPARVADALPRQEDGELSEGYDVQPRRKTVARRQLLSFRFDALNGDPTFLS